MHAIALLVLAFALQTSGTSVTAPRVLQPAPEILSTTSPSLVPQPDENGVYHDMGHGIITPPQVTYQTVPQFSKEARKKKFNGQVLIGLVVDSHGLPINVHVIRSAAEGVKKPKDKTAIATLDQKALEAVTTYRFKPATLNGKPVPVELHVEVNFQIF